MLFGLQPVERAIRHVLREAFLQPQIIEPAHGGEVSEPLMRQLVQAQKVAANKIAVGGRCSEQHRLFAQECSSRVLHTAIGETRNQDEIVFGKRKRLGKVIGKELHSVGRDLLQLGSFLYSSLVLRLAHPDSWKSRSSSYCLEGPCRKSE